MKRLVILAVTLSVVLLGVAVLVGCAGDTSSPTSAGPSGNSGGPPTTTTTTAPSGTTATSTTLGGPPTTTTTIPEVTEVTTAPAPTTTTVVIDPADFSATITNHYFPVTSGAIAIYEVTSGAGPAKTEVVATGKTRVVMGVECVVIREIVYVNDEMREETYDWYAQDGAGNVWYFGADAKRYEGGAVVSTAGSWEAGVDRAAPGIIMKADPQPGDVYQQQYLEDETAGEAGVTAGITAEVMVEVREVDATLETAYGTFLEVVKTKEWSPLQPGVVEEKYYAPGVGLVLVKQVEGGSRTEELIEFYAP